MASQSGDWGLIEPVPQQGARFEIQNEEEENENKNESTIKDIEEKLHKLELEIFGVGKRAKPLHATEWHSKKNC